MPAEVKIRAKSKKMFDFQQVSESERVRKRKKYRGRWGKPQRNVKVTEQIE